MALHIIWSTFGVGLPQEDARPWPGLFELYERLAWQGNEMTLSHPMQITARTKPHQSEPVTLAMRETHRIIQDLTKLTEPGAGGDRITGNLPILALAVQATGVHLLIGDVTGAIPQVVGRLKSKTSSWLLRSPERRGQKHVWSGGYWWGQVLEAAAVEEVGAYILSQQ